MPQFSHNPPKNAMMKTLTETLSTRLDEIGLPADCITRKFSWDDAANECWRYAGEQETEEELMYVVAMRLYLDALNLWEAIISTDELFKNV